MMASCSGVETSGQSGIFSCDRWRESICYDSGNGASPGQRSSPRLHVETKMGGPLGGDGQGNLYQAVLVVFNCNRMHHGFERRLRVGGMHLRGKVSLR